MFAKIMKKLRSFRWCRVCNLDLIILYLSSITLYLIYGSIVLYIIHFFVFFCCICLYPNLMDQILLCYTSIIAFKGKKKI